MTLILPRNKGFFPDSALASKMGQIQKNECTLLY